MAEYRVNMNKHGRYIIQKKGVIFGFIPIWKDHGYHDGAAGHVWFTSFRYNTKEEAFQEIIKLTAEDQKNDIENEKIQQKRTEFKPIVVSSEDIREKFPQYFL